METAAISINSAVSEIMTRDVFTIEMEGALSEAQRIMTDRHVRHLPVVKDKKLVGILSLSDIQRLSFSNTFGEGELDADDAIYGMLNIVQVMCDHPNTVELSTSIREVAAILTKEEYHALPVVSEDELVGIVTTTDVIKYLLKNCEGNS